MIDHETSWSLYEVVFAKDDDKTQFRRLVLTKLGAPKAVYEATIDYFADQYAFSRNLSLDQIRPSRISWAIANDTLEKYQRDVLEQESSLFLSKLAGHTLPTSGTEQNDGPSKEYLVTFVCFDLSVGDYLVSTRLGRAGAIVEAAYQHAQRDLKRSPQLVLLRSQLA